MLQSTKTLLLCPMPPMDWSNNKHGCYIARLYTWIQTVLDIQIVNVLLYIN